MGASQQQEIGSSIRLLVWNIYKAKRTNWLDDFTELCEQKDLVLLQEAVINAPSDHYFNTSDRYEWLMASSHQNPQTGVITGVKTGCVAQIQRQLVHRSRSTEPFVNTQKLLLETHYAIAGSNKTLMVLNMHAINFVRVNKYLDQLDQLRQALAAHDGPIILGGDFNTWSPNRLALFQEHAEQANLVEANMTRRTKMVHLNQHLDHVFYRGVSLRSVEALQHVRSSDHSPIAATFTVE